MVLLNVLCVLLNALCMVLLNTLCMALLNALYMVLLNALCMVLLIAHNMDRPGFILVIADATTEPDASILT